MANVVTYVVRLVDKMSPTIKRMRGALKRMRATISRVNSAVVGMSKRISNLGVGIAITGISMFVKKTIGAFNIQEQAMAQVRQGLQTTQNVSGKTFEELTKMASDFQKNSLFSDEDILQGVTAQILTFTNIAGGEFDRIQQSALDVTSRLYGAEASAESLRSTSIMLGKAMNDPVANLGALGKAGIQFSDEQKAVIKQLAQTGNLAEAQSMILSELETQYGGSAKAAADAGAGGLKQLSNRFGDIQEKIGKALLPMVSKLSRIFGAMADWVDRNEETFSKLVTTIATVVAVIGTIIIAIKVWTAVQAVLNAVMSANPIALIIIAIAALVAAIIWVKDNWKDLGKTWDIIVQFMKLGWEGFVENLKMQWQRIKNGFELLWLGIKNIGQKIKAWFVRLGESFELAFQGDWEGAQKRMSQTLETEASKQIKALEKQVLQQEILYDKQSKIRKLKAAKNAVELAKIWMLSDEEAVAEDGIVSGLVPPVTSVDPNVAKEVGENVVQSGGIKQFNINIQQLTGVKEMTLNSVKESAENIGKQISQALLGALADVQVTS